MRFARGILISGLLALCSAVLAACDQPAETNPPQGDSVSELVLLGTRGGPGPLPERSGIASLLTIDGRHYLVDAGGGVAEQLARAGVPVRDIGQVFLTHLHDDHTAGLPALMTDALMTRTDGMTVYGPPQTNRLVDAAIALLDVNADIRIAESNGRIRAPATPFDSVEVGAGVVYQDARVTVTAVENTHYSLTSDERVNRTKSYALRFDTPDRSIVFTGDTGPSAAVEKLARGADTLVAEMVSEKDIASVPEFVRAHMLNEHLSATEVGRLAAAAGVATVIVSHVREPSREDAEEIARHFDGRVVIGEDLQRF